VIVVWRAFLVIRRVLDAARLRGGLGAGNGLGHRAQA